MMQAQVGKVGINTVTPAAMLHVKDSSVLFTGIVPLPFPPGNPPVSGAGTRMMWYPDKAAFRAGNVTGTHWNKDSIRLYSIALGFNPKAKGNNTIALGAETIASGIQSVALGSYSNASGDFSTAMGGSTTAGGTASTAMGAFSVASGGWSTAMGSQSVASGSASTSMGQGSIASGYISVAMGYFTTASSEKSTAMGANTKASGSYSTALGSGSEAKGSISTSMGYYTTAFGNLSTAIGNNTKAKSFASVVLGQYNDTMSLSETTWNVLDPVFVIGNGSSNTIRNNAFTVLKNGKTGINNASPFAMLHVVKDAASGGPYNSNAAAIFEGDQGSFIQLSNDNAIQSGILSGNEVTAIRSALIFSADSSITMRTGGNLNRAVISNTGNFGIGTTAPAAKLDVNGSAILGANGTVLTEVIKQTVLKDVASIAANTTLGVDFAVANSATTSTVFVSPENDLTNGIVIAFARVSAAGNVKVGFRNTTGAAVDPASMNYYITVIR